MLLTGPYTVTFWPTYEPAASQEMAPAGIAGVAGATDAVEAVEGTVDGAAVDGTASLVTLAEGAALLAALVERALVAFAALASYDPHPASPSNAKASIAANAILDPRCVLVPLFVIDDMIPTPFLVGSLPIASQAYEVGTSFIAQ